MSECYDPATPVPTGPEYVDVDGDGYAETIIADADGDGYVDTVRTDVDGAPDFALVDSDYNGYNDTVLRAEGGAAEGAGPFPGGASEPYEVPVPEVRS